MFKIVICPSLRKYMAPLQIVACQDHKSSFCSWLLRIFCELREKSRPRILGQSRTLWTAQHSTVDLWTSKFNIELEKSHKRLLARKFKYLKRINMTLKKIEQWVIVRENNTVWEAKRRFSQGKLGGPNVLVK